MFLEPICNVTSTDKESSLKCKIHTYDLNCRTNTSKVSTDVLFQIGNSSLLRSTYFLTGNTEVQELNFILLELYRTKSDTWF